jgi:hypothetical protein
LHRKGVDVNRTDLEQKAAESVLAPLADYVMAVGMQKGLGSYSKGEIIIGNTHQAASLPSTFLKMRDWISRLLNWNANRHDAW